MDMLLANNFFYGVVVNATRFVINPQYKFRKKSDDKKQKSGQKEKRGNHRQGCLAEIKPF